MAAGSSKSPVVRPWSSGATFSVQALDTTPDPEQAWMRLANACPDAWFWHTWTNLRFNVVAAQESDVQDLSFLVLRDGEAVGLVPLLVARTKIGDVTAREASYYGGPLPWPAFLPALPDFAAAEAFALTELEARARSAAAERIRLRLEPPFPMPEEAQRLERAVRGHHYLNNSYSSHCLTIDKATLNSVRERYRRYVKKFCHSYDLSIAEGAAITATLEETYFELHVKDAGGQFRSRASYRMQADLVRSGEGFFVVAQHRASNKISGMLLVSVFKRAAYDNSVAVDPERQHEYVSHLLKWKAIETLLQRGVSSYELGLKSDLPRFMSLPSEKNRGISHFKEGWARSSVKKVLVAEKFLTARFLQAFMQAEGASLQRYFGLQE